jgi:ubiquinone/menaquinone biosynthesis C-methylase UbiE
MIRKVYGKLLYKNVGNKYAKAFSEKRKPRNGLRVLDIGCEVGLELIDRYNQGYDVFGVDINKEFIKKLEKAFKDNNAKITLKVADAARLPFQSNFFDEVICSHLIEHVKDDKKVLQEVRRVLKPGGMLCLRVPHIRNLHTSTRKFLKIKNCYTDRTHLREYDRAGILRLANSVGFREVSISHDSFLPPLGLRAVQLLNSYIYVRRFYDPLGTVFKNRSSGLIILCKK